MNIDAFIFNSELDLLRLRLEETEDWADKWVLVESDTSFTGKPKPASFEQNQLRFRKWLDRIVHCKVSLNRTDFTKCHTWRREFASREALGQAVASLNPQADDVIHTSDVDEIPCAKALERYTKSMGLCGVEMPHCYYHLNCFNSGWGAARIGTWWQITSEYGIDFQYLRHNGKQLPLLRSDPDIWGSGGWHLSFMGGVQEVQQKLQAFAHDDLAQPEVLDPAWLSCAMACGVDLFTPVVDEVRGFLKFHTPIRMPKAAYHGLVADVPGFSEYWLTTKQLYRIFALCRSTNHLEGDVVSFGSLDGLVPNCLASVDSDKCLQFVTAYTDDWNDAAKMMSNAKLVGGRVNVVDCWDDTVVPDFPIRFACFDRYDERVGDALRNLVPGGVICGRAENETALQPVEPCERDGNLWWWRKP